MSSCKYLFGNKKERERPARRQSSRIVSKQRAFHAFPGGTGGFLSLPERICRVLLPHPQDSVTMSTRREGEESKQKKKEKGKENSA